MPRPIRFAWHGPQVKFAFLRCKLWLPDLLPGPTENTVLNCRKNLLQVPIVPSRRLEERILRLCVQALEANRTNSAEVFSKLRAALREHVAVVRKMAVHHLAGRGEDSLRRCGAKDGARAHRLALTLSGLSAENWLRRLEPLLAIPRNRCGCRSHPLDWIDQVSRMK